MSKVAIKQRATVDRVENGYIVETPARIRVALDEDELATVFRDLWDDEPGDDLPNIEDPAAIPGVVMGTDIADVQDRMRAASAEAKAAANDDWPTSLTPGPSPKPGRGESAEVQRVPIADADGTEYPAVRQLAPNHFVMDCPSHGETRLERAGATWKCMGKTNKQSCVQAIPRDVIGRLVASTAA